MSQDLRKMFGNIDSKQAPSPRDGHEKRFLGRLEQEFPISGKVRFPWFGIAASAVVLVGISLLISENERPLEPIKTTVVESDRATPVNPGISLGDLSPDLQKVENYYLVNINLELSRLEISDRNKALIDSFMERLEELNKEYGNLNGELNTIGPNDQIISALINNLQLRLQLLHKLKEKLQELKVQNNVSGTANTVTHI